MVTPYYLTHPFFPLLTENDKKLCATCVFRPERMVHSTRTAVLHDVMHSIQKTPSFSVTSSLQKFPMDSNPSERKSYIPKSNIKLEYLHTAIRFSSRNIVALLNEQCHTVTMYFYFFFFLFFFFLRSNGGSLLCRD